MDRWLTFDCYDTLVRYTEGKQAAVEGVAAMHGAGADVAEVMWTAFQDHERAQQTGPFVTLTEMLMNSLDVALATGGFNAEPVDREVILDAVKNAAPFADVKPALDALKAEGYKLAILSNSEPEIMAHNIARIGVDFDDVVLAFEAKCYKPARGMFDRLIEAIGGDPAAACHVAQSLHHDIRPTVGLGFRKRIWANRYGKPGDPACAPDVEIKDFRELAAAVA